MLSKPVHLAIVDDHALFRSTLKNFLSEQHNIKVTVQASDIFDLLRKLKHAAADIILMDVFLPELYGTEALKVVRHEYPDVKVLVLSMSTDLDLVSELLDIGIHGYVSKAEEPDELMQAIKAVADNRIYRNRIFTEALYRKHNNPKDLPVGQGNDLNDREKKVLQLIWDEKSNKEMAEELFLGIRSVEKIRQDIKEKLGVKSTVGLLKYAIKRKIVNAGSQPTGYNLSR